MPRPLYETEANTEAEVGLGQIFARYYRAKYVPIQGDNPHIDGAYLRDGLLVAFSENKRRNFAFGGYPDYRISKRKVLEARKVDEILRVPVFLVLGFSCGTIAYLDFQTKCEWVERFGRQDRGDILDTEPGAAFEWRSLKIVKSP
jgi:hypothetical protein